MSQKNTQTVWVPGFLGQADFECLLDLVEEDLRYMKNNSGQDKIVLPKQKAKKDEVSGLDDPDLNGDDEEKIEVASASEVKKKLRRVKLKRILIPGVTKGIASLPKALEGF